MNERNETTTIPTEKTKKILVFPSQQEASAYVLPLEWARLYGVNTQMKIMENI
jgi:hypothetical protein